MIRKVQDFLCWSVFGIVVLTLIAAGGYSPAAWSLMAIGVLALFCLQIALSYWQPRPSGLDALWIPTTLFLIVLVWGGLQRAPWVPEALAHPVWEQAEAALLAIGSGAGDDWAPVISADPGQGAHVLMRFATYAMIFWIALRSALSARRARAMLRAVALASSLFALYGIITWAVGINPILNLAERTALSSTFVNRNNYATFAAFGMLANLAMFFKVTRSAEASRSNPLVGFLEGLVEGAWIWLLGLMLCTAALLLTQSRGGAIAALAGVVVLLVSYRRRGEGQSHGPLITAGFILVLAVASSAAGLVNRAFSLMNPEGAFADPEGRAAIYPRVIDAIWDRPWLGHGLGAFHDVFRAYVPQREAFAEWHLAHSSYLENIFELGIPAAALLYLALALVGLRILRGMMHRRRERAILAFVLACYVTGAVHSIFDFSLQMPGLAAMFAWVLGLGYAQSFSEAELTDHVAVIPRRRRRRRKNLLRKRATPE